MTNITLQQGNCLDLLTHLPAESVDAIICDLPYGTTLAKWDVVLDLDALWKQYLRIAKPTAPILLFASQPFTSKLIMSQAAHYRHLWYWQKEKGTNFFRTGRQPLRVIEEVCVFARQGGWTYNAQMVALDKPYRHTLPKKRSALNGGGDLLAEHAPREYKDYTHAHPTNCVSFARDKANKSLVPTQKPIALLEYLVRTYTNEGDIVLDNTMGSGTCGVAAKRLRRSFIGMEMNPEHFAIAQKRIDAEPDPDVVWNPFPE